MNKNYRSVWNDSLGAWVAVSEVDKPKGRRASSTVKAAVVIAAALGAASPAFAENNQVTGTETYVTGKDNGTVDKPVNANSSTIVGNTNILHVTGDVSGVPLANTGNTHIQGNKNNVSRIHATVMGSSNTVNGEGREATVAIGNTNTVSADGAIAIGKSNSATANSAVAIGTNAMATQVDAIAIGNSAQATGGQNATALGSYTKAGDWATAIGTRTHASANQSAAFGTMAYGKAQRALAFGTYSYSNGMAGVAMGYESIVVDNAHSSVALGAGSVVSGAYSGVWNASRNLNPSALTSEHRSFVGGNNSYAIGNKNIIGNTSNDTFIFGNNVKLGADSATLQTVNGTGVRNDISSRAESVTYDGAKNVSGAVALGSETKVNVAQGVALGYKSNAGVDKGAQGADLLGVQEDKSGATWTSTAAAVSVGDAGAGVTRQITSLAAGTADTDAVNVAQLNASGFTLSGKQDAGGSFEDVTANEKSKKIANGSSLTFDAGKNIKLKQDGSAIALSTADNVSFTEVTATDGAGNNAVLGAGGLNIASATGKPAVSLTSDGLNNGGNVISQVGKGIKADDAVNIEQLGKLAEALGVTVSNADGSIDQPSFTVTKADGSKFNPAGTVQDALNNIGEEIVKPITFGGDTGEPQARTLGGNLNVKGGADVGRLSENNIGVVADAEGLKVKLSKNLDLTSEGNVIAGTTVLDGTGISVNSDKVMLTAAGLKAGNVNLGTDGVLTGIEAGVNEKDAVNFGQLRDLEARINGAGSKEIEVKNDKNTVVTKDEQSGKTVYTVGLTDDVELLSLTAGAGASAVKIDGTGVNVGGINYINQDGLNANNQKITQVGLGEIRENGTDAVATGQLYGTAASVSRVIGGKSQLTAEGYVTSTDIGGTGQATVHSAIESIRLAQEKSKVNVTAGDNIVVTPTTTAEGTVFNVETSRNLNVDSVTSGDTVLSNEGLSITGGPSVTKTGIVAGGKKITGLERGENPDDAVNKAQLDEVQALADKAGQAATEAAKGWKLQANDGEAVQIASGNTLTVRDGKNIKLTTNGNELTVATADDLTAESILVGETAIGKTGVEIAGGPSLTKTGISAGGKTVRDMADGSVAEGSKDGITGNQLHGTASSVAAALGGGSQVTPEGRVTAPQYTVAGEQKDNVGDAVAALDKAVANPLVFAGDNTDAKAERKLGSELSVKGGATGNLTENNIGVTANADGLSVKLAEKINLGAEGSLTAGNTLVDKQGIRLGDTADAVSLTVAGLNNGGQKITGVADGLVEAGSKEAVNGGQLFDLGKRITQNIDNNIEQRIESRLVKGIGFSADEGKVDNTFGKNLAIVGGAAAGSLSEGNIGTVAQDGKIEVKLSKNLKGLENIGAERVEIGSNLRVASGAEVDMGGNTIHNVGAAKADTDAVNLGQLRQELGRLSSGSAEIQNKAIKRLDRKIRNVDANNRGGIAQALATANLGQAYLPGKSAVSVGTAYYRGEQGYALGYSGISDNGNWLVKGSASGNSRGHYGVAGSVTYQW